MGGRMKQLYYWYFRKRYNVPCRAEIKDIYKREKYPPGLRIRQVAEAYLQGLELQEIAKGLNITQERVRQILLKIVRNGKRIY